MRRFLLKPVLFLLASSPAGWLLYDALNGQLSANPIEDLTYRSGDWALRFLLITLALSPLKNATGWTFLIRYRRMLGLFAFFYVLLHFLIWLALDHYWEFSEISEDIVKRPYITVGFSAFIMLLALALTSTRKAMRKLGRNWKKLHQLIYPAAVLAVLHYLWLVKADILQPLIYAGVLVFLLLARRIKETQK
ncbi:MAG: sulfoxide reductase heme-binding subunit YedZ [gamma proteobacterium symbiont of Bathyaustriella thionipta]|nr:sulfoxide reductase heme-binding subunit YedZ [gamma proteobacterium symbiont of Bathyaustriella thionipta]